MGIVFHTKYTGKTLDSMTAGFGWIRGRATNVFLAKFGYRDVSGLTKLTKRSELTQFADKKVKNEWGSLLRWMIY